MIANEYLLAITPTKATPNHTVITESPSTVRSYVAILTSSQIAGGTKEAQGSEGGSDNVGGYAGAAAGAVILIIITIVIVVVLHNRSRPHVKDKKSVVEMSPVDCNVRDKEVLEDVDPQPIYELIRDQENFYDSPRLITSVTNPHYGEVDDSPVDTMQVIRGNSSKEQSHDGKDDEYTCMDGNLNNPYDRLQYDQGDDSLVDTMKITCGKSSKEQSLAGKDNEYTCMDGNADNSYDHPCRITAVTNPQYGQEDDSPVDIMKVNNCGSSNDELHVPLAGQDNQYVCMDETKEQNVYSEMN